MPETTSGTVGPPMPAPDPLTQFFWDGLAERKLLILRCRDCGHYIHYPRPVCRFCRSVDLAPAEVSGRATLYSWTTTVQAFHPGFVDKVPYTVAVVELVEQENLRMVTNIVDCDESELRGDMALEVTFREAAPGFTLPYFCPAPAMEGSK